LITPALVLVLVEILSDLWAMQTITDIPLRVLNDTAVFSTTMTIAQLFEAVFCFLSIPLGVYLIIRRSPWKATKVVLDNTETIE
jgi:ACR3 family arsenite efflux pump ArsB